MAIDLDFFRSSIRERAALFNAHASQIGHLCVLWSSLEMDVSLFLVSATPLKGRVERNVYMGSMEFRSKLKALVAICFERRTSDTWFTSLQTTVNKIDNDLRTERNRMVHDFWSMFPSDQNGTDEIHRITLKPKVVNVQSRTRQLKVADVEPITAEDISDLCDRIIEANASLRQLQYEFELSPFRGKPASEKSLKM